MPSPDAGPPANRTIAWSPIQLVALGVTLMIGSMVVAFFSVTLIAQAEEQGQALAPGGHYLAAIPGTLLLVLGFVAATLGTLRWAIYGRDGKGAPVPFVTKQQQQLDEIAQRLVISETAKRVAYRLEDVRLLRDTIEIDIKRKEFDAALVLVRILAEDYGQIEESETFRERIEEARGLDLEERVGHEVARLDEMLARNEFARAARQADRIKRLFPTVASVREIEQLVHAAREQHKHDLERKFLDAAGKDDVELAMSTLKELDRYLDAQEAKRFEEVARGVIGKQRDNLGVQFKLAVHDKEWLNAVSIGEQIIREFPNTRMADEVRGMLDLLRERAAGQQAASA